MDIIPSFGASGMFLDTSIHSIPKGGLSFALNTNIQSHDGSQFIYTNELSTQLCVDIESIKPGFKVIGVLNIVEQNKVIVFLSHPDGRSEIGEITDYDKDCLSSDPTEEDCGCTKGTILTDKVESSGACCKYKALLTDDCCSTCDSDCRVYRIQPPPGNFRAVTYIDCCTGQEVTQTIDESVPFIARVGSVKSSIDANIIDVGPVADNLCGCNPSPESCCLKFDINFPISAKYKTNNCGTTVYFISRQHPVRHFNIDDPLGLDGCGEKIKCLKDACNKLNLAPDTCHPEIIPTLLPSGGQIKAGTVQFTLSYCDRYGFELTDYFDLTNPISISDRTITSETDYITSKSIRLNITHSTDVFDYYNLVAAVTENTTTIYYLVERRKVTDNEVVTYTGDHQEEYNSLRVLNRTPKYGSANIIETSNDILFLADLESDPEYNLQPLVNKLNLFWETVRMPADNSDFNYANGIVAGAFRGYMRDENYLFGIKFLLKNGKYTRVFPIPGRAARSSDLTPLTSSHPVYGKDVFDSEHNCPTDTPQPFWKIYNTVSKFPNTLFCSEREDDVLRKEFDCEIYQGNRGEFAYAESTLKYPCNEDIWGELADTPIRFHKFPDCAIDHIHNDSGSGRREIYPIGVRVDNLSFDTILNNIDGTSLIYNPRTKKKDIKLSDLICGFQIVRSNRVGNKSVIAKGLTFDVGEFNDSENNRKYFYANYPYNDLRQDPFLSKNSTIYDGPDPDSSFEDNLKFSAYAGSQFRRFTLHSPDTHFQYPKLGTELKLESCEYGKWQGHFVPVQEHPRYKFLTKFDLTISSLIGAATALELKNQSETVATPPGAVGAIDKSEVGFNIAAALGNAALFKDLIEKAIPHVNYAWQYNSIADYDKARFPVKGNSRRVLDIAKYAESNNQYVGDENPFWNRHRESSVYLRTTDRFDDVFPTLQDNSRNTLSSFGGNWCEKPQEIRSGDVKANYCSIKRFFPDQYGPLENVSFVDTGEVHKIEKSGLQYKMVCKYYPTFGGDIFINKFSIKRKMPFWLQNMVSRPDDIPFDYQLVPNIAYPTYYIGTSPDALTVKEIFQGNVGVELIAGLTSLLVSSSLPAVPGLSAAQKVLNVAGYSLLTLGATGLFTNILSAFIPKNNLDCDRNAIASDKLLEFSNGKVDSVLAHLGEPENWFYQDGKFYLAAYGIPTFFVESDVNVDLRHGRNTREEDFFPHVGVNIPDDWLQEYNVPILHDNYYFYNRTFSKQNYENYNEVYNSFVPDEICHSYYPNRVIYSDVSTREEKRDAWKVFRTNNYYDFPKTHGRLININTLENDKVLARFENSTAVYNSRIVLDSKYPINVELGTGGIFAQRPVEYSKTDIGYLGTQNKAFVSCKYGHFWVDAKRGFVYQITGQSGMSEISKLNFNWFKQNLPFKITKDFPTYSIDNNFKDIGLIIGWDERYERVFITKRDYSLLPQYKGQFEIRDNKFYNTVINNFVSPDNEVYFRNESFTIGYSPIIKNWISFYSFIPNFYIAQTSHLQSGNSKGIWNHGISPLSYQVIYDELKPYILEYPYSMLPRVATVGSVTLMQDIRKYYNHTDYYSEVSLPNDINFNKAILYNNEQCTGQLNLIYQKPKDLKQRNSYPKYNKNSIDVLFSKREQKFTFNSIWDIVSTTRNNQPLFVNNWSSMQQSYFIDKVLNDNAYTYANKAGTKIPLRAKECRVRLIQDKEERYKFINYASLLQINNSTI